jgi:hypothetical protein
MVFNALAALPPSSPTSPSRARRSRLVADGAWRVLQALRRGFVFAYEVLIEAQERRTAR